MDITALRNLLASLQQQSTNNITSQQEINDNPTQQQQTQPNNNNNNQGLLELLNSLQPVNPPNHHSAPSNSITEPEPPTKRSKLNHSYTSSPNQVNLSTITPVNVEIQPSQNVQIEPHPIPPPHSEHKETTEKESEIISSPLLLAFPTLIKSLESNILLDRIQEMKEKQDELELRLIDERNRIKSEHDRMLKKIIGSSNSDKITKLRKDQEVELMRLDRSALTKWEQLKNQQQIELENLQVPSFCQTNQSDQIIDQKKIIQFLLDHVNK